MTINASASRTAPDTRPRPAKARHRAWTKPDFVDVETPMEVTAYAARA
jgi:coenzyme PQQ precursor peptide PqqA